MAYEIRIPERQSAIAELNFGVDSQILNVWKSGSLNIYKFAMSPQGLVYATGFRSDYSKAVTKLTRGQSITAELVHIIDPATGEERHLFPITLRPKFDSQAWLGLPLGEMTTLAMHSAIGVKSNGNFFLTIDRTSVSTSIRDLIKNEAVEYSPDGTVARTWKLGRLEPNDYLNRIFVDVDDSLLAEIISYPDTDAANSTNGKISNRYLLRVGLDGMLTRYELPFPLDEVIQGWIGQTRELATLARGSQPMIKIHRLPF
jgi:hypothetical protein